MHMNHGTVVEPLVSVIVPMYNAERHIAQTLDSLLKQTYSHWECIIVDDGSTDSSPRLAQDFCARDTRFRYYRVQHDARFKRYKLNNAGPSGARNDGYDISRGDFIQYLDSDDVLLPQRFEILLNAYGITKERVVLYSDLLVGKDADIYETTPFHTKTTLGKDIDYTAIYTNFYTDILFIPGCVMFPRDSLHNIRWDESLGNSEDWEYYLQVSKHNRYVFRNVPLALFIYRDTKQSRSTNLANVYKANYSILERYRDTNNTLAYCKQCGYLIYRNVLNSVRRRISVVVLPFTLKTRNVLLLMLLLPVIFVYCAFFTLTRTLKIHAWISRHIRLL